MPFLSKPFSIDSPRAPPPYVPFLWQIMFLPLPPVSLPHFFFPPFGFSDSPPPALSSSTVVQGCCSSTDAASGPFPCLADNAKLCSHLRRLTYFVAKGAKTLASSSRRPPFSFFPFFARQFLSPLSEPRSPPPFFSNPLLWECRFLLPVVQVIRGCFPTLPFSTGLGELLRASLLSYSEGGNFFPREPLIEFLCPVDLPPPCALRVAGVFLFLGSTYCSIPFFRFPHFFPSSRGRG